VIFRPGLAQPLTRVGEGAAALVLQANLHPRGHECCAAARHLSASAIDPRHGFFGVEIFAGRKRGRLNKPSRLQFENRELPAPSPRAEIAFHEARRFIRGLRQQHPLVAGGYVSSGARQPHWRRFTLLLE